MNRWELVLKYGELFHKRLTPRFRKLDEAQLWDVVNDAAEQCSRTVSSDDMAPMYFWKCCKWLALGRTTGRNKQQRAEKRLVPLEDVEEWAEQMPEDEPEEDESITKQFPGIDLSRAAELLESLPGLTWKAKKCWKLNRLEGIGIRAIAGQYMAGLSSTATIHLHITKIDRLMREAIQGWLEYKEAEAEADELIRQTILRQSNDRSTQKED